MAARPVPVALLQQALDLVSAEDGSYHKAAKKCGIPFSTLRDRYHRALHDGLVSGASVPVKEPEPEIDHHAIIKKALRKGSPTLEDLSTKTGLPQKVCEAIVRDLQQEGSNVHELAPDKFSIEKTTIPAYISDDLPVYVSRPDNSYLFGACGDKHLGSKYHREDVLNDLYDRYEEAEVDRVFDTGNWIDGEASFNKHDLLIHGMDAQLDYLVEHHPQKEGIVTYAVAGDDHEGWYAQREGVNIGKYLESKMRAAGREDWVDLGYMEAHVILRNANSGKESILACVHPGGGSSYAISYSIQKIIESLEGGEKPAVGLYGHYHKQWGGDIRNVWVVQTGCCQDQTPFARKKKLDFRVGGALIKLEQDPESGAIIEMTQKMRRYFNRGFYNNRWSHSGSIVLPDRGV